ncbi:MAG TPA: hypothetical protein VKW04_16660 [Planctomycetota bacterium]|nr:hypothetical protein [Planctomycetota bacterium]
MNLKRLKLQHDYHDGIARAVEYSKSEDIALEVDLCGCAKTGPSRVHLTFTGVRNFAEVKRMLEAARLENTAKGLVAEIVGIARHDERGYVLDVGTPSSIKVDAKGLLET